MAIDEKRLLELRKKNSKIFQQPWQKPNVEIYEPDTSSIRNINNREELWDKALDNKDVTNAIFEDGVVVTPSKQKKQTISTINGKPATKDEIEEAKEYNKIVRKYNGDYMSVMRGGTLREREIMRKYGTAQVEGQLQGKTNGFGENMSDAYLREADAAERLNKLLGPAKYLTPRAAALKHFEETKKRISPTALKDLNELRNLDYYQHRDLMNLLGDEIGGVAGSLLAGPFGPMVYGGARLFDYGADRAIDNFTDYNNWVDLATRRWGWNPTVASIATPANIALLTSPIWGNVPRMARNFRRSYLNATQGGIPVLESQASTIGDLQHARAIGASELQQLAIREGMRNSMTAAEYNMGDVVFRPSNGEHLRFKGYDAGGYGYKLPFPNIFKTFKYKNWVGPNRWKNVKNGRVSPYIMERELEPMAGSWGNYYPLFGGVYGNTVLLGR